VYQVTGEGPEHARRFTAQVTTGPVIGLGEGTAKKHAEQAAAEQAYVAIKAWEAERSAEPAERTGDGSTLPAGA
jgi:dsRNA-specific ribonuclease